MSLLPPSISRILIAAIVLECVVLGVIHVRRWLRSDQRIDAASEIQAPADIVANPVTGPEPAAGPSRASQPPPARPAPPRTPGSTPEGPSPVQHRPGPAGDGRITAGSTPPGEFRSVAPVPGATAQSPAAGRSGGANPARSPGAAPGGPVPGASARPPLESAGATPGGLRAPAPGQPGAAAPGAVNAPSSPSAPETESDDDSDTPDESVPEEDDGSTADNTPPVLEGLRFDPPEVQGGSVVTLTVQASDTKSGLKSIRGEIRSPNRSAVLSFGSYSLVPGNVFTFPITLPSTAQTGTWYVAWISLTDGAANVNLIQAPSASAAPPGGTFAASSSESDATPPEVLQVWFDKASVGPGEKNAITVEARDDRSGIASMMGACQSPSKSALVWFTGAMNADAGRLVADVAIPKTADCGEWVVQQLAVKDTAGNTTLLKANSPLLSRAGFRVSSGTDCDFAAPTLEALDVSPTFVQSGVATDITLTARVYDVGSGAAVMTGWFEGPVPAGGQAPRLTFSCQPDPRDPEAPWIGRVRVPLTAARGTWKVGSLRLEDKAKNASTYTSRDPIVSGHGFKVE